MRHIWISAAILTASGPAGADVDPCAGDLGDPCAGAEPAKPAEPKPAEPPKDAPKLGQVRLRGVVRGKTSNEALAGVTIVAMRSGVIKAADEGVVISDEKGAYRMDLPPGTYTLTFYYIDVTLELPNITIVTDTFVPTFMNESQAHALGCVFWLDHSNPERSSWPRFGLTTTRGFMPVSRDRTHRAWIAPSAPANPRTTVTTIAEGVRLQRAPGIPIAFVDEVSTSTLRVPIELATGSGGASDVSLRGGSNETKGDARLVFGLDRARDATLPSGGVEVFSGGPLKRDMAWLAAGLVANRRPDDQIDAHGMAKLNFAAAPSHQGEIVGLAQALGDGTRDGWAQARWTSKFDDNKLEVNGGTTVEQLDFPAGLPTTTAHGAIGGVDPAGDIINRAGGQVGVKWRRKMLGHHMFGLVGRAGGGLRGTTRHDDATIGLGDDWQIRPHIELQVGARAEARRFGDARTQVLAPRASLKYDFTQEGRSDVFIAYQRVPRLDDGLPGDWLVADARYHDELATGVSYLPTAGNSSVMFGVGGRARWTTDTKAELGLETWVRYDRVRNILHASATTLGNIGTLVAQRRIVQRSANDLLAGVALRMAPDRREGGGSVVWKHAGARATDTGRRPDLSFDLSLEGYGGTEGPAGRLLLGASW